MPSIVFDFQGDSDEQCRRFIRDWDRVHRSDPHELGAKTSLSMEPYLRWVRIRAQKLGMLYEAVLPIIVEVADEEGVPPTILHTYMPTDIGRKCRKVGFSSRRKGTLLKLATTPVRRRF